MSKSLRQLFLLTAYCLLPAACFSQTKLSVTDLTVEYMTNPIGLDVAQPRFSWKMISPNRNARQTAYEIMINEVEKKQYPVTGKFTEQEAKDLADLIKAGKLYSLSTGKVMSDKSVLLRYPGASLKPITRYNWKVRIWDEKGNGSDWSAVNYFETGLLSAGNWQAKWIEPQAQKDTSYKKAAPSPFLRKSFTSEKEIVSARVYATAHGIYELYLNGKKVSDDLFTPGWTSYNKRLQYQTYDVTGMLNKGANCIGAILNDGWYRGSLTWKNYRGMYGKHLGLLCQLHIIYKDGTDAWVLSDGSWKCTNDGPIRSAEFYHGEVYDARMEIPGWCASGFNDRNWNTAVEVDSSKNNIVAQVGYPVRRSEELQPLPFFLTSDKKFVADMQQNMVGRVRIKVHGAKGDTVTIRFCEVLDKEGNFYTKNLRKARNTIKYICKGTGEEVYEPHFFFTGFRYIEVEGLKEKPMSDNFTGMVLHSALPVTGSFECSNPLINQLQHNILWSQKGNFVDIPTDCPQRDERMGWTGDAQVFCGTAAFNMNVAEFFTKWLADMHADQDSCGSIPYTVPELLYRMRGIKKKCVYSTGWADAITIIPWTMYLTYGDTSFLSENYDAMKKYVELLMREAGEKCIFHGSKGFGDWLFYQAPQGEHEIPDGYTDQDYISTAFFAYSTTLLGKAAKVLGKEQDAKKCETLFRKIKQSFNQEFFTPTGRVFNGSQTGYVLALMFNLVNDEYRDKAVNFLVEDIKSRKNHLSTGFLGTPYICPVLEQNGRLDVAYTLLEQDTFPSWLYQVRKGATTMWEKWNGINPDSTFDAEETMNSFNHYAYGAIGGWMYSTVAGIKFDESAPGYRHIIIHPQPGGHLSHAMAVYKSMYGDIGSGWEISDGKMKLIVKIPPNTIGTVILFPTEPDQVTESGKYLKDNKEISSIKSERGYVQFEVGSGEYTFQYPVKK